MRMQSLQAAAWGATSSLSCLLDIAIPCGLQPCAIEASDGALARDRFATRVKMAKAAKTGLAVGFNMGHITTVLEKKPRPSQRKGVRSLLPHTLFC